MRHSPWFTLLFVACFVASPPAWGQPAQSGAGTNAPATLPELRQRISERLDQPRFAAALWGAKIVSLDTGEVIFERNAEKLFAPASNSKLYTVSLALHELGSDYRIKTSVYAQARPDAAGVVNGDLVLYGRGDPTINARLHGANIANALDPLARALTNAGVKLVTGRLVADSSYFRGPEYGSGWMCDDPQYYYGAEISALTINDNILQAAIKPGDSAGAPCRVMLTPATDYVTLSNRTQTAANGVSREITVYRPLGGNVVYLSGRMGLDDTGYSEDVTVHEPAGLFAALFRDVLARHRVKVEGTNRVVNWLDRQAEPIAREKLVELAAVESLPVRELAREIQKPSQNLYTDLLLAHVGERTRGADTDTSRTSEELGVAALNKFLREAEIPRGSTFFEEGSGLSRDNLVTPSATVALLEFMDKRPYGAVFVDSLPIAGVDGTLRNRMKGTPAAGNVRAKTGTLRWATSLSGYVKTAAGERVAFSLMLNRYQSPGGTASSRNELDAVAVLLARFTGRTSVPAK